MECLLPYLCMVTVPHLMVRLERMLDYRGVGLVRFHCNMVYGARNEERDYVQICTCLAVLNCVKCCYTIN